MNRLARVLATGLAVCTLHLAAQQASKATIGDRRWGSTAFQTAYQENIGNADKVAGLSELWAQAKFDFANFWHVPTLDWDQAYREYLPRVVATKIPPSTTGCLNASMHCCRMATRV